MSKYELTRMEPAAGVADIRRLELTGRWLEEAGFPMGSRVEVEVATPGRLSITPAAAAPEVAESAAGEG